MARLLPEQYTETGYVSNLFTIGPAILWFPFLLFAHLLVLLLNFLGMSIAANGFSIPYLVAMALGTAIYGFLGLLLSFSLARKYVGEQWAFLATVGIWWGSSLPVYMYFNPAWSHAHSAFAVALFLWYWDRTRPARTTSQWLILGLISGLMVDIYFPNGVFLMLPLIESLVGYAAYLKFQPQAAQEAVPSKSDFCSHNLFRVSPHDHHPADHLWRLLPFWLILTSFLGVGSAALAFSPILPKPWALQLDTPVGPRSRRSFFHATCGSDPRFVFCGGRRCVLLSDL